MGELPAGKEITQRDLIEFMSDVKHSMESFKEKLLEFKDAIEELANRNDLNADTIRSDFSEKLKALEKDVEDGKKDIEDLKKWRLTQAAWIAGALAVMGVVWIIANKVSDKLFK